MPRHMLSMGVARSNSWAPARGQTKNRVPGVVVCPPKHIVVYRVDARRYWLEQATLQSEVNR